jgi:hypothetical protein
MEIIFGDIPLINIVGYFWVPSIENGEAGPRQKPAFIDSPLTSLYRNRFTKVLDKDDRSVNEWPI